MEIDFCLYFTYGVWIEDYTELLDCRLKADKISKATHKRLCRKLEEWNEQMEYYYSVG